MATLPSRIGNFEVLRQIGSGGMGAVYLGRDPELDRQVAIKVIREEVHDQEVLDRFFREARAAAALRHPNIISIYASGQHDHRPYMVMEFVDGESLADTIRSRRTLTITTKLSYLEQLCAGLHFAHRAGIVHRDIKPANVMVDRDGIVRILDFGIARIEGSAMTQDGALIGSLNYMSPEQMLGRPIDQRSDIFSLGAVAYELVCYQQAFKGGLNDGLLQRLPYEDPPSLQGIDPGLPPGLEDAIMHALQKTPENRFQDLAEMRGAIVDIQRRLTGVDDQRTIVIPRAEALRTSPGTGMAPPSTPASWSAPPLASTPDLPRPATAVEVRQPPEQFGEARGSAVESVVRPETPAPGTQTWQVKKPAPTAVKRNTTVTKRPITATPLPQPVPRPSSRKWILVGSGAAALLVGAAAAIPWLTAAPPNVLDRERPAIEAAMERFRIGYRNRDLGAVTAAFPALPRDLRQAMQRTFNNCLVYEVTFDELQVEMTPTDEALAQVDVRSTHTCTPQSGGRQVTTPYRDVFILRKNGDSWMISDVTRPPAASPNGTE